MSSKVNRSTERFSDRVQNYTRYRPSYPTSAIDWLVEHYRLTPESRIADIGSGTGIFTELLMSAGLPVLAVEPNDEMRMESDRLHSHNPLYSSLPGTAEATLLEANSINMIVAAQAFHWFNSKTSKQEFKRVLQPDGVLALIWNKRDNTSDFQSEYESVLSTLPDYGKVKHTNLKVTDIEDFIGNDMRLNVFENSQIFDLAGFRGRVFSSSYTPSLDDAEYQRFSQKIDDLFDQYSSSGKLSFTYNTEVYSGHMD